MNVDLLFEPLTVKGLTLRNRVVMPPMVTNRDITSEEGIAWYRERAAGGVGLVIVESTPVTRINDEFSVEALRPLVDAIHAEGAAAAIQLFPVAYGGKAAPADLTEEEVYQIIESYQAAAGRCAEAGFDGVEPHGAHGFLLNQFFSPVRNTRTDEFGGSLENRMRLGVEVVKASRRGIGEDRLVLYRHTPVGPGYTANESLQFVERLIASSLDVLDISPASDKAPADLAEPFVGQGAPVIAVNDMDDPERAAEALEQNRADLIAIGRGLIADPQWPRKVREGRLDDLVECTKCDEKCFGYLREGKPIECTQW